MGSIFAVIVVLGILIGVHELGHFLAAKMLHIPVRVFAIGFGPSLIKFQWQETQCQLNIIPLGGFCAFEDDRPSEDDDEPEPEPVAPRNPADYLSNRPVWQRAIVISAGVTFNAIFAYITLVVMFFALGVPTDQIREGVRVGRVMEESPAKAAGVQSYDRIMVVAGQTIKSSQQMQHEIKKHPGKPIDLLLQRGGNTVKVTATPNEKGLIGVEILNEPVMRPINNVAEPFIEGGQSFVRITGALTVAMFKLFTGQLPLDQIGGPIMVVDMGAKVAQDNFSNLFLFTALISIELAIINLLPLPALDGGHLFFLLIEGIRGRPLPKRIEAGIHQVGLVLLLALGFLLIFKDILSLSSG